MSPEFRAVFYSVVSLTGLCGVGAVFMTLNHAPLSAEQKEVLETLLKLLTLGAGAIIGLLGGLATVRKS